MLNNKHQTFGGEENTSECKMRDASAYSNSLFSSFQDQLDEYEAERKALLCQNNQAKDEVGALKVLYSQCFA